MTEHIFAGWRRGGIHQRHRRARALHRNDEATDCRSCRLPGQVGPASLLLPLHRLPRAPPPDPHYLRKCRRRRCPRAPRRWARGHLCARRAVCPVGPALLRRPRHPAQLYPTQRRLERRLRLVSAAWATASDPSMRGKVEAP